MQKSWLKKQFQFEEAMVIDADVLNILSENPDLLIHLNNKKFYATSKRV